MKIGIIGAGRIGGTLARRFSELGYTVSVANSRGPESLAGLARKTGAKAVSARQAARSGDVLIVTIPEARIPDLPKDLFDGVSPTSSSSIPATTTRSKGMAASPTSKRA